jgi:hypothetical protein
MSLEDLILFQRYGIKGYTSNNIEEKPDNEEISKKD